MYFIRKLVKNNKGATAIEYGLIAALIAVAAIAAVRNVGAGVGNAFNTAATGMSG
jgi:pilus assembly protein Flp/PilA